MSAEHAASAGAMPSIRAPAPGHPAAAAGRSHTMPAGGKAGGGGSGGGGALVRSPMFNKPFDDDEHEVMQHLRKGVVQCFVSGVPNSWTQPWSKGAPSQWSGSGFVIDLAQRLIVTNAHVIQYMATLQVRKDGDYDKHEARILAVNHQVDLAIITVRDDAFWHGAVALPIGDDPRLQAHIDVVGYPKGGTGVSITSGVVSRIDWNMYTHGMSRNLCVTVDAPINSGNSGGPAISKGKVAGVSFQSLKDADGVVRRPAQRVGAHGGARSLRRALPVALTDTALPLPLLARLCARPVARRCRATSSPRPC